MLRVLDYISVDASYTANSDKARDLTKIVKSGPSLQTNMTVQTTTAQTNELTLQDSCTHTCSDFPSTKVLLEQASTCLKGQLQERTTFITARRT